MTEIRPFTVDVPQSAIDDLRDRVARARWPEAETVDDWTQGTPLAYTQELCAYWADGYDWRRCEAGLNAHPNFLTEIDGLDLHFQHIRSPHEDATPLVVTHGWPGTIVEFQGIIEPLTNPTEHGGTAADAFHLVLPSLPGYGWSEKPATTGTGVGRIATMWDELMVRLGYDRYVAQGGDWGGVVTTTLGALDNHCVAIHTNMPLGGPPGEPADDELTQAYVDRRTYYDQQGSGYFKQQSTRPQTLGYGLADSPAGQAAWIAEKMWDWTDNDGHPESALTRDQILDNISVYWFTNTAASSARIYWEPIDLAGTVDVPTAVAAYPHEVLPCAREWAEWLYTDIRSWNTMDRGGHFAAWEVPDLFVDELRRSIPLLLD